MDKVCLITGVGPGTGTAITERFAKHGYRTAMLARNSERLNELEQSIPNSKAYRCDVGHPDSLTDAFQQIEQDLGSPDVVIHNAVNASFGSYMDIKAEDLRQVMDVNLFALLQLAQLATPGMQSKGHGVIICTGNTSAYRGKANFAGFAPTKAAQRIMLESIARHAGPLGIHAAYLAIDAVIDLAWTRKSFPDKADEFFCQPADIAEECFRLAHQPKSAWSAESVIRPFGENW
jgi:NAD(P)-dependent dehydrogenase (short-subunit alcohol dehydrogenase family)